MKALCIALSVVLLLALAGCTNPKDEEEALPLLPVPPALQTQNPASDNNSTPSGAVAGLMDAVIAWDLGVAAQFMTDADGAVPGAYAAVVLPFIERLEYELGNEKITGNTAVVDIAVTAVDASGAFTDLTVSAAKYAVGQAVRGGAVDMQQFLGEYITETLDFDDLTRTKRYTTVHLTQDSLGRWRLDTANEENQDFYNALSGGLLDTALQLQALAEEYDISW